MHCKLPVPWDNIEGGRICRVLENRYKDSHKEIVNADEKTDGPILLKSVQSETT